MQVLMPSLECHTSLSLMLERCLLASLSVTATVVYNKNDSREHYNTLRRMMEGFPTVNSIWPDGNYGFPGNVTRGMRKVTLRGGNIYGFLKAKIIREEETWQTPSESSLTLA